VRHVTAERVGIALVVGIPVGFVVGLAFVANVLPHRVDGPTPPVTRVAYYVLFAACLIALSAIPLVMWSIERLAGVRAALTWRLLLVFGAVLAMGVLGWGVHTWAYPPHDLRQCFPEYRGNSTTDVERMICTSGLANIPLGDSRLLEGFLGAVIIAFAAGIVAARMALPPRARPSAPAAPPAGGRAGAR
jgi:ABC-type antimicrobial peptide transport system permease subunit